MVELGGMVGSLHYAVAGSPTYQPGERVLLFLDTNDRGEWVSKAMAVGKFTVRGDLLVRAPLCGWNYDGTPMPLDRPLHRAAQEIPWFEWEQIDYKLHPVEAQAAADAAQKKWEEEGEQ